MKRRTGFTLIELLAVMLLIGTLTALAVPRFREYKTRAFIAAMQTDLGNLKIAQELHWADHLYYATDTAALEFRVTSDVTIAITSKSVNGGYTAIATHSSVPGHQCLTSMGPEAAPMESGAIVCGSLGGGSTTIAAP